MYMSAISFTGKSFKVKRDGSFLSSKETSRLIDRPAKLISNRKNYSGKVKDKKCTSRIEDMEDIIERNPNSNVVKNIMQEYIKFIKK